MSQSQTLPEEEEHPEEHSQPAPLESAKEDSAVTTHRYPERVRSAPDRYVANTARRCCHDDNNPKLRMALDSMNKDKWEEAIKSELDSLTNNGTWEIVDKPNNSMLIYCKWALKKKRTADGELSKYKARLVICGKLDNVPIAHKFAAVVDFTVVRLVLAVAAQKGWLIHQVDYSNAFIQGSLDRKVYMHVPKMIKKVPEGKVCLLRRSLYGLREAPSIWYALLSKELRAIGMNSLASAPCVFVGDGDMILCYVDDLLVMAEDEIKLSSLKQKLAEKLPANDMGLSTDFLGIDPVANNTRSQKIMRVVHFRVNWFPIIASQLLIEIIATMTSPT